MADAALSFPMTLDAFLEWEERQPERYEFLEGVVKPRCGGTEDLDRLSVNLIGALSNALRGGPCTVHASNLKVAKPAGQRLDVPRAVRPLR